MDFLTILLIGVRSNFRVLLFCWPSEVVFWPYFCLLTGANSPGLLPGLTRVEDGAGTVVVGGSDVPATVEEDRKHLVEANAQGCLEPRFLSMFESFDFVGPKNRSKTSIKGLIMLSAFISI